MHDDCACVFNPSFCKKSRGSFYIEFSAKHKTRLATAIFGKLDEMLKLPPDCVANFSCEFLCEAKNSRIHCRFSLCYETAFSEVAETEISATSENYANVRLQNAVGEKWHFGFGKKGFSLFAECFAPKRGRHDKSSNRKFIGRIF